MKFLASALLVLVLVPIESVLGQEPTWQKLTTLARGTKIEVVDAQSGAIEGQLVSIDEQGLTLRRKGGVTETIARSDVVSVTVKRPSAKKIALLALGGSALGALAGGSRCKGPTDYNSVQGTTCRNPNGYYFDGKGGAIGAGAGAALGLLGFAFPSRRILYERSLLAKNNDSYPPIKGANSEAAKESSLQSFGQSAGDTHFKPEGVVLVKADCGTKLSEKGDCHAAQE